MFPRSIAIKFGLRFIVTSFCDRPRHSSAILLQFARPHAPAHAVRPIGFTGFLPFFLLGVSGRLRALLAKATVLAGLNVQLAITTIIADLRRHLGLVAYTLGHALHDGRPVFLVLADACQFGHGAGPGLRLLSFIHRGLVA